MKYSAVNCLIRDEREFILVEVSLIIKGRAVRLLPIPQVLEREDRMRIEYFAF